MSSISLSMFDQLDGAQLQQYLEPLLAQDDLIVTQDQVSHLLEALRGYNQYHLVYALELCSRYDPGAIAPVLPEFLLHAEGSVVCAAINILESLPATCLTVELLDRLETVALEPRWGPVIKSLREKLRERLRTKR